MAHLPETGGLELFGSDIQDFICPGCGLKGGFAVQIQIHGTVQEGRFDTPQFQGRHLVLHQGDQGRDDHRRSGKKESRDLIAEGFPGAGRHHTEHIPAGEQAFDQRLLAGAEGMMTVYFCEGFQRLFVHGDALPPVIRCEQKSYLAL